MQRPLPLALQPASGMPFHDRRHGWPVWAFSLTCTRRPGAGPARAGCTGCPVPLFQAARAPPQARGPGGGRGRVHRRVLRQVRRADAQMGADRLGGRGAKVAARTASFCSSTCTRSVTPTPTRSAAKTLCSPPFVDYVNATFVLLGRRHPQPRGLIRLAARLGVVPLSVLRAPRVRRRGHAADNVHTEGNVRPEAPGGAAPDVPDRARRHPLGGAAAPRAARERRRRLREEQDADYERSSRGRPAASARARQERERRRAARREAQERQQARGSRTRSRRAAELARQHEAERPPGQATGEEAAPGRRGRRRRQIARHSASSASDFPGWRDGAAALLREWRTRTRGSSIGSSPLDCNPSTWRSASGDDLSRGACSGPGDHGSIDPRPSSSSRGRRRWSSSEKPV